MEALVRAGIKYNQEEAREWVLKELLEKI